MKSYKSDITADPSGFVVLADYVPHIVQEIRYYSTYNFIGERIDGYEEPCALLTKEAARALKSVSNEMIVQGYRLKIFDAYRPACAVKHFVLWGIEDQDIVHLDVVLAHTKLTFNRLLTLSIARISCIYNSSFHNYCSP